MQRSWANGISGALYRPVLSRARFQQCFGLSDVRDVHTLGARAVDRCVQCLCFLVFPLLLRQVAQAQGGPHLASGGTRPVGAECRCGVHGRPPGVAGEHSQEEYGWPPIFFPSAPQHGLVLVMTQNSVTL